MKAIELPIYYHTDQTETLNSIGIESSIGEFEIKPVIFYSINAVSHRDEGDTKCSTIHSNGDTFVCSLTIDEVRRLIEA